MSLPPIYTYFFGSPFEQDEAIKTRRLILDNFRRPFVKNNMSTHGPLWNQYINPQGIINISDIEINQNIQGYILVDGKGKNMYLFLSSLNRYFFYLKNRDDGIYPAIYFVDKELTFCFGENGERGAMKPIYIYKGTII